MHIKFCINTYVGTDSTSTKAKVCELVPPFGELDTCRNMSLERTAGSPPVIWKTQFKSFKKKFKSSSCFKYSWDNKKISH